MAEGVEPTGGYGGQPPSNSVNVVVDQRTEVIGSTFRLTLKAHRTLRVHPEYEKMVWDLCLRLAHEAGYIPVGSILVTDKDIEHGKQDAQLLEGVPMMLRDLYAGVMPPLMEVVAEVEIGAGAVDYANEKLAEIEEEKRVEYDIDEEFRRLTEGL